MSDLISMIVPIYNGTRYIDKFVKMFKAQTYSNLELLLVDDGSKDDSLTKCKKYESASERIRVFYKENGGPSSARNYGVKKAKGKYIVFADVDDIIYPSYVKYLYDLIRMENADLSICACMKMMANEDHMKYQDIEESERFVFDREQAIEMFCYRRYVTGYSYLKLIRMDLAKEIKFSEEVYFGEDFIYTYDLLKKCNKIVYGNKIQYIYIQYTTSSTHMKIGNTDKYKIAWDKHLDFLNNVKEEYPLSYKGAIAKCYILAINNTTRVVDKKIYSVFLDELYSFIRDNASIVWKDKKGKKSNRILGLVGMVSVQGLCGICKMFFYIQNKCGMTLRHTT